MEPFVVFSVLFVMLVLTVVIWKLDYWRARGARIEPTMHHPGDRVVTPAELRERITTFFREHPALDGHEEHGHLYVTWFLPEVHAAAEPPPERTFSLELRLRDQGTAAVQYGEGKVSWFRRDDEHYGPTVSWDWDATPDFGHGLPSGERMPDPNDHSPHSLEGLLLPIQRIVLDAGWAWQPVLELPIEEPAEGAHA